MKNLLILAILVHLPLRAVATTCPAFTPVPTPWPPGFLPGNLQENSPNSFWCENTVLMQLDVNGPILTMDLPAISCVNNQWVITETDRLPVTLSCVDKYNRVPDWDVTPHFTLCKLEYIIPEGRSVMNALLPDYKYCPENRQSILEDGTKFKSVTCNDTNYLITLINGTVITRDRWNYLRVDCGEPITTTSTTMRTFSTRPTFSTTRTPNTTTTTITTPAPTTTTTVKTTTTIKKDTNPTAAQLWDVNAYYNYGVGVHAFCADSVCISAIQSNGIGYDMTNGKVPVGKAVRESAIAAVRAACPTGSAQLRNLGFTKSGNKYLHNFSGTGLKVGWVSIANGACGATRQIKRWKSRYTDDMMYDVNLEWNTWYQGMVQEGGKVQFYMWN